MTLLATIQHLIDGKGISTGMLAHLPMTFDQWLAYAQLNDNLSKTVDSVMLRKLGTVNRLEFCDWWTSRFNPSPLSSPIACYTASDIALIRDALYPAANIAKV